VRDDMGFGMVLVVLVKIWAMVGGMIVGGRLTGNLDSVVYGGIYGGNPDSERYNVSYIGDFFWIWKNLVYCLRFVRPVSKK